MEYGRAESECLDYLRKHKLRSQGVFPPSEESGNVAEIKVENERVP